MPQHDPECNYDRIKLDLITNGFSEKQVQAVFVKTSNAYPKCDLSGLHCLTGVTEPDAFTSERTLGNIVRYLKCCKASDGTPRYPKLHQVFISSRTYGGYPTTQAHGCLMPEPFAYEESFAVQRLIVSQINRASDGYSGSVRYPEDTPWVDWGPYLWADRDNLRSDGLNWCNGQNNPRCNFGAQRDVRWSSDDPNQWGDFTHPSALGAQKAANQLVKFFTKTVPNGGSPFVQHWNQQ